MKLFPRFKVSVGSVVVGFGGRSHGMSVNFMKAETRFAALNQSNKETQTVEVTRQGFIELN